ncbi:hypothetical protein GCM10010358_72820 [Streptomyces minutiscleroticus]|uniref:Uncharacterized protein n=1 Tax=Streptomyces minutiscleroticus TaxID=68238 RepID=A0A918P0Z8_9ACTN|nr:hypothetical protein GCM10010358_72820 [Streptomyces minutiscleroticus]
MIWSRDGEYETIPTGTAEFIEGWTTRHLSSRLIGGMEPDLAPWFNSFRPRTHRCLRLSEGPLPHHERLRLLRNSLAPATDRGAWRTEDGQSGQDHFATTDTDWHLTYDMANPHQIRVSHPPHDHEAVHQRLSTAIRLMGCDILTITTAAGTPPWPPGTPTPTKTNPGDTPLPRSPSLEDRTTDRRTRSGTKAMRQYPEHHAHDKPTPRTPTDSAPHTRPHQRHSAAPKRRHPFSTPTTSRHVTRSHDTTPTENETPNH